MRIFISGGCKNGKSYYAQRLAKTQAAENGQYYYIATMAPTDVEDDERIARHRRERDGWGFATIEQASGIDAVLDKCDPHGSLLLDSVTALLANEMFLPDGSVQTAAAEKITGGLLRVIAAFENIVIVSDYIYSDAVLYDPMTEFYRQALAKIDRTAADACEIVLEAAFGGITVHKSSGGSLELPDFGGAE